MTIGVCAIKVLIQEFSHGHVTTVRCQSALASLFQEHLASLRGFSGRPEPPTSDLVPTTSGLVPAQVDLQVPTFLGIPVDAFRSLRHLHHLNS